MPLKLSIHCYRSFDYSDPPLFSQKAKSMSRTPGVSVCRHCSIMFRWGVSSLFMSLQLSTTDGQWGVGWGLLIPQWHFNSQLLMADGVGPSHSSIHLNSNPWWLMGGWVCLTVHVTSTADDQWWGTTGPPHCSSHQPNSLWLSNETKLTSIAVCQHSLS